MIKQNVKLTKEQRLLRSALGKFAPLFNHLRKIEADLTAAGEPGIAQVTIQVYRDVEALEKMIMNLQGGAGTAW